MPRRRYYRTSDNATGALIALALVMWVISVIIQVLIIGAAIGLAVGLVWFIIRHVTKPAQPKLAVARPDEAPRATTPDTLYRPLAPPDPAVFEDPTLAEVAALNVFRTWARGLPAAPKDPAIAVRDLKLRTRSVGRLLSECVGRHVIWKRAPYSGRAKLTSAPIAQASVDPWEVDLEALREESRYHSTCGDCGATGRVGCQPCYASGQVSCADCNGLGKVHGYTAHGHQRILNCKQCRGKGTRTCTNCTRGRLPCSSCDGKKKVVQWLDIVESARIDIQIEPDGDVTRAFMWGKDGVAATDLAIAADAKVLATCQVEGMLSPDQLPDVVSPRWVQANWEGIQPTLQAGEQVRHQRFSYLEIPSIEVTYSLDNQEAQTIELEGRRLLAPPVQVDRLFAARARRLRWIAAGLATVPLAIGLLYLVRGAYFASGAVAGLVGCAALACAGLYMFFRVASLGRTAARWWAPGVALPLLGAAYLGYIAEPRLATAEALVAAGDREAALRELRALGGPSDRDLAPLYAALYLADAKATSNWKAAYEAGQRIARDAPAYGEAMDHAFGLMAAEVREHTSRGAFAEARLLLETAKQLGSPAERAGLDQEIAIASATQCHEKEDWDCLFAELEARDLGDRGAALRTTAIETIHARAQTLTDKMPTTGDRAERIELGTQAMAAWMLWSTRSSSELPKSALRLQQQLDRDTAAEEKVRAAARARQARERERAAAAAAREQRKREAAEQRARAREEREERRSYRPSSRCCKVCTTGCACGNSCISCSKTCRKGPGCAC